MFYLILLLLLLIELEAVFCSENSCNQKTKYVGWNIEQMMTQTED